MAVNRGLQMAEEFHDASYDMVLKWMGEPGLASSVVVFAQIDSAVSRTRFSAR